MWLSYPWNDLDGTYDLSKMAWYITDSNGILITISEIICPLPTTTTTTTEDVTTTTTTVATTTTSTTEEPTTTTTTTINYEGIVYRFYNSVSPANSNTTYNFLTMTSALEVKCAWDHFNNNPNGVGGSTSYNNTQESINDGDYISVGDIMVGSGYTNPINDGYYSYYDADSLLGNPDSWAIKIDNGAIVSMDSFSSLPSCDTITTNTTVAPTTTATTEEPTTTTTTTEDVTTTTTTEDVTTTTTTEEPTTTTTTTAAPTYSLSVNGPYPEGSNMTFTLTTTNLNDGDVVPFGLGGTATIGVDYSDRNPKEFVISNNSATYFVTTFQDNLTESGLSETIILTLAAFDGQGNGTFSESVTGNILDTSQNTTTTSTTEDITTTTSTTEDVTTTTTTEDITTTTSTTEDITTTTSTTEDVTTTTTTEDVTTTTTTEDVTTTTTTEDVTTTTTTENITTTTTYSLPPSYQYFKSTVLPMIDDSVCDQPGYELSSPFWVDMSGYTVPNLLGKPIFKNPELTTPVTDGYYLAHLAQPINSTNMSPIRWIQVINGTVSDVGVTDCDDDTPN